ncbi:PLP-dependent aspartate aminotransferase family protein [Actinophytocola sp.]|uniref:trans-sulfuration enzyme family protein n=1 Tax=Actinophytocola sp. TaxID=1872138 RepID=UPI002ED878C9
MHSSDSRIETLAVHGGERVPGPDGSMVFPIYQSTVYTSEPGESYHDIKYLRLNSTPSQAYLHDKLAALEGAEAALATASGMAAITTILHTLLRAGDHLLVGDVLYGGTHNFLTGHAEGLGLSYTMVDPHRPDTWAAARRPNTKAFLVETITNPLMRVGALREVVAFARAEGLVSVVDNTFASPVNFRPLAAGFDLVFHSATKYLNGHSDLVAGSVAGSAALVDQVRKKLNIYGGSLDPHAGFLLARGMKTLAIRVRAQNANAEALAEFLAGHEKVAQVNYPGLADHPDHAHAAELLSGFGGMLSFRLAGGVGAADALLEALRLPAVAPSLGGIESLVTRPSLTSHAGMSPEDRAKAGVADDLIRFSCGIEHPDDLLEDVAQALDKV